MKQKLHGKYQPADIPAAFPTDNAKQAEGSIVHAKNALNRGELTWVQYNQVLRRAQAKIPKTKPKAQA